MRRNPDDDLQKAVRAVRSDPSEQTYADLARIAYRHGRIVYLTNGPQLFRISYDPRAKESWERSPHYSPKEVRAVEEGWGHAPPQTQWSPGFGPCYVDQARVIDNETKWIQLDIRNFLKLGLSFDMQLAESIVGDIKPTPTEVMEQLFKDYLEQPEAEDSKRRRRNPDEQLQKLLRETRQAPTRQNIERLAFAAKRYGEQVYMFMLDVPSYMPVKGYVLEPQNKRIWAVAITWLNYITPPQAAATAQSGFASIMRQKEFRRRPGGSWSESTGVLPKWSLYLHGPQVSVDEAYTIFQQQHPGQGPKQRGSQRNPLSYAAPHVAHPIPSELNTTFRKLVGRGMRPEDQQGIHTSTDSMTALSYTDGSKYGVVFTLNVSGLRSELEFEQVVLQKLFHLELGHLRELVSNLRSFGIEDPQELMNEVASTYETLDDDFNPAGPFLRTNDANLFLEMLSVGPTDEILYRLTGCKRYLVDIDFDRVAQAELIIDPDRLRSPDQVIPIYTNPTLMGLPGLEYHGTSLLYALEAFPQLREMWPASVSYSKEP